MHAKDKNNKRFYWAIALLVAAVAALVLVLVFRTSVGQQTTAPNNQPTKESAIIVHKDPLTAAQVTGKINCTQFVDRGSAMEGLVRDSGTCWINGVKYGIDTFGNPEAKKTWIQAASPLGMTPKWEGETWVAYVAHDQS